MEKQYKGAYFTPDKKAKIEWCLKWNGKHQGYEFTASGSGLGYGGQCLDHLLEAYPHDKAVTEIHAVWKEWHLNSMRPGTPGHERAGCAIGKYMPLVFDELNDIQKQALLDNHKLQTTPLRTKALKEILKKIRESHFLDKCAPHGDTIIAHRFKPYIENLVSRWCEAVHKVPDKQTIARGLHSSLGRAMTDPDRFWWNKVVPKIVEFIDAELDRQVPAFDSSPKFLQNSLGYPCPDNGSLFGHEWFFESIPEETLKLIKSWSKRFGCDKSDKKLTVGELYVRDLCQKFGIDLRLDQALLNKDTAPDWAVRAYTLGIVKILNKTTYITFPYYTGGCVLLDTNNPYAVLGSYFRDAFTVDNYWQDSFEEFCSTCGYDEDSRKAYREWQDMQKSTALFRSIWPDEVWKDIDWELINNEF